MKRACAAPSFLENPRGGLSVSQKAWMQHAGTGEECSSLWKPRADIEPAVATSQYHCCERCDPSTLVRWLFSVEPENGLLKPSSREAKNVLKVPRPTGSDQETDLWCFTPQLQFKNCHSFSKPSGLGFPSITM